jgi:hypothetical protein
MRRALTTPELRRAKLTRDEFLTRPRRPLTVVLDGVSQNYNIGTIFRLCDAFLAPAASDLQHESRIACLTLFAQAASDDADRVLFKQALDQFYGGEPDPLTMELLRSTSPRNTSS